jgi:hypothetical protein
MVLRPLTAASGGRASLLHVAGAAAPSKRDNLDRSARHPYEISSNQLKRERCA